MKLRVLGCSGGIGGKSRTTSFLLDDDILIDAGTGVEDLTVEEMANIDHVFLTHSHLDHCAGLPLMIDSVGGLRDKPMVVHALAWTIEALRQHIFNWVIWPDFTEIPHYERPWIKFEPLAVGQEVILEGKTYDEKFRSIRALTASHTVPAIGFELGPTTRNFLRIDEHVGLTGIEVDPHAVARAKQRKPTPHGGFG